MKFRLYLGVVGALLLMASCKDNGGSEVVDVQFVKPSHFPEPVYNFAENEVTTEGFVLGRTLFYDGKLSRDNSISCGSCHQQSAAFTHHGHDLSHGIDDQLGSRNAPPVMNLAWQSTFFWDGGVHDLDLFSLAPIENPVEMDEKLDVVLEKLRNDPRYPPLFNAAFGTPEISTGRLLKALSQFMLMCVSADSDYDRMLLGTGPDLSTEAMAGMETFNQKCASCHSGVLFTDYSFRNNGLNRAFNQDAGRERITLNPEDRFKFKVPSLRNVARTGPYMHDGRYYNLEAVLNYYASGMVDQENLDPLLRKSDGTPGIDLSANEKENIIAFLKTLSDEQFIRNPELAEQ
ncbi:MAG: cytochrome-c peroxidase [Saprospiraceae bacterium]|nr:cytochrome-c peroxidase [Saprospiraceae bacterium]